MAPCAVALLPGYVVAFLSRNLHENSGMASRVGRGLKLILLSIVGILLIYLLAGSMILVDQPGFKELYEMDYHSYGIGVDRAGYSDADEENVSFSFHFGSATGKSEVMEAFVFGIVYTVGALGCLFPLFLVVATQAMVAPSVWQGLIPKAKSIISTWIVRPPIMY